MSETTIKTKDDALQAALDMTPLNAAVAEVEMLAARCTSIANSRSEWGEEHWPLAHVNLSVAGIIQSLIKHHAEFIQIAVQREITRLNQAVTEDAAGSAKPSVDQTAIH